MAGARRIAVAAMVVTIAMLLTTASAGAAVYWNTGGGVGRANTDGSWLEERFIAPNGSSSPVRSGSQESISGCEGIAVDGSHVYWAEASHGAIARADLDGSNVNYSFITGLENPCGVAVDGSSVYWTDYEAGTIGRANLEGGEVQREYMTGLGEPCGIAVGGGYLYWTADSKYEATGAYLARSVAGGIKQVLYKAEGLCGVAVDSTHVYFGGFYSTIGRAELNGGDPEPSFISGAVQPCGIAISGPYIYWAQDSPQYRAIAKAEIGGPHVGLTLDTDGVGVPCGIAVDERTYSGSFPPAPAQSHIPSDEVTFQMPRHSAHRPVVFVTVNFPQKGSFVLTHSKGASVKILGGAGNLHTIAKTETRTLKVSVAGGAAGAALRKRLRKTGRARVSIAVWFAAGDGAVTTGRKKLLLLKR